MAWNRNAYKPSGSGGVSVGFHFSDNENEKRLKEEADRRLFNELLDRGYPEDRAAYLIQKRNSTGELDANLPTFQNAAMSGQKIPLSPKGNIGDRPNRPVALPPVRDIPERSTLKDFNPMERNAVGFYDAQNPTSGIDLYDLPRNANVKSLIPTNKPKPAGRDTSDKSIYRINPETGELEKIGVVAHGSQVVNPPQEDPLAKLLREREAKKKDKSAGRSYMESGESDASEEDDTDDLEAQAKAWLEDNGAPVTPANIQAVIKKGLVRIGGK